jgi:hypothetical protein
MKVFLTLTLAAFTLGACSLNPDLGGEQKYPTGAQRDGVTDDIYAERDSIFGEGGIALLGGGDDNDRGGTDAITVNSFLWRASLDTVSFMPLTNVDPFGGVILTDWYSDEATPDERYKLNVFVTGSQLRSDAIRVSAFQQKKSRGTWRDVKVDPSIATKIEDAILTRARQIRVASR